MDASQNRTINNTAKPGGVKNLASSQG